jgi:hypothetical protein
MRRGFRSFVGRSAAWLFDIAPFPHLILPVVMVFLLLPFVLGVRLVTTAASGGSTWAGRLLLAAVGGLLLASLGVLVVAYLLALRRVLKEQRANSAVGRHSGRVG